MLAKRWSRAVHKALRFYTACVPQGKPGKLVSVGMQISRLLDVFVNPELDICYESITFFFEVVKMLHKLY